MSLKNRLSNVLGGESFDDDVVAVIPPEEQPIVLADGEIAQAEVVVAQHEAEITEIQSDIETVEERLEVVEEELAGLESMMSGETEWNPALAQKHFNLARKAMDKSFGECAKSNIDGVENFADVSTAKIALIEGLESITERAKAAGKAVVEFFKNLYKSIIAVFVGLFDRLRGVEKRADALSSRLNSLTDDKLKKSIKLGAWNAYLDVDKTTDVLGKLSYIDGAVTSYSKGLTNGSLESMSEVVSGGSNKAVAALEHKKSSDSAESHTVMGGIAGVEFEFNIPKVLKSLRTASVTYKLTGKSKTDGEYADNMTVTKLKGITDQTKKLAAKARIATFDQKALEVVRNKAIATVEAAGSSDAADKVRYIKDGHAAITRLARVLTRYQGDVLIAAQKYVAAHW